MIVKNEAPVIERCLTSVLPLIDYWIICDTGSTDGTQDIIRSFFAAHDKPGELHERPWQDFAHNRSEALALARDKADYSLIIDADDTLELPAGFKLPRLKLDSYTFEILHQQLRYFRAQLVRNTLPWVYEGVLHEFLSCGRDAEGNRIFSENRSQAPLPGVRIRMTEEGARRRQSRAERYKRDAAVLETALKTETDPFLIARYAFYLAQSLADAGEPEQALPFYLQRATLGFWQQEVYISLYEAAKLKAQLNHPPDDVIEAFDVAGRSDPRRAEALHDAARYCRLAKRHQEGYEFAKRAIKLSPPQDSLFAERWIYDYAALDEYAVNAYWAGQYEDSLRACRRLLAPGSKLPASEKNRIEANRDHALRAIRERRETSAAGTPLAPSGDPPPAPDQPVIDDPSATGAVTRPRICLNMIVKNEMANLERCLASVADHISCWVIGDTGSTDGTQEFIRDFFARRGIPGELHEFPFVDFAQARNEALGRARASTLQYDYLLFTDADMELTVTDPEFTRQLSAEAYLVLQRSGISYWNIRLVRREADANYKGVTHEFLDVRVGRTDQLPGIAYIDHASGSNRIEKYERDARLLRGALAEETDPGMIARYTFYLANTLRDTGQKEAAILEYLKRAKLGCWQEEVFQSLYNVAQLKQQLGCPIEDVITAYLAATESSPTRAEALHGASRFCRNKGLNQRGYEIAKRGLELPLPANGLFVENWIYEYGLKDEFAVNAYWSGHYRESLDICLILLDTPSLPNGDRQRIVSNARFAVANLDKETPLKFNRRIWEVGTGSPIIPIISKPAISAGKNISGLVSIVTPTFERHQFLKRALRYVRHQEYRNIEWLVLDDGQEPCKFLSELEDPRIRYEHSPQRLSIGEKRNRLIEKAQGEHIVHFDDDDYYARGYITTMLRHLHELDCDLINLRGWYAYDCRSRFFGYWDIQLKEGPHYRCDRDGVSLETISADERMFSSNHLGFGFSYAFKRKVWEETKFADIDWNEDGDFSLRAQERFRLGGVHDTTGLCLHYMHQGSTSRCYPQYHLPSFLFGQLFPQLSDEHGDPQSPDHEEQSAARAALGQIHVINLDRSTARLQQFRQRNIHLADIIRYPAVDGAAVNRAELISSGILADDCPYSSGAIGCALSHIHLWRTARAGDRPTTIFEDDTVAVAGFDRKSAEIMASLPPDWDLVMWGYVFDPFDVWADLTVAKTRLHFLSIDPQHVLNGFLNETHPLSTYRLLNAWGTQAYTITPRGASILLDHCLPLKKRVIQFSEPGVNYYDQGIDGAMNAAYPQMKAYICVPPLVVHDQYGSAASDRSVIDSIPPGMRRVAAQHPHWKGFLLLSQKDDTVVHEGPGARGRYRLDGQRLAIAWDQHAAEEFIEVDGVYTDSRLSA
jgi:glycosyltransferase involved in cell wall biosynthesis/GR25 family glycosyltransferase involved in LPS biosynthesis